MITSLRHISVLTLLATSTLTLAGGPLTLEGANGNTPVTYSNPTIVLDAETGPLGTAVTNAEADALMTSAFALWNNVNTSTINLSLNDDAIADPNLIKSRDLLSVSNAGDGLNPVIYDANGEIIDDFFGADASLETAGFAASFFTTKGDFFLEGYAVINGRIPPQPQVPLSASNYKLLIAHEMGHLFGLDHSQVNINNKENTTGATPICQTAAQDKYPVMYPFICRSEISLHADDISAVSTLYPAANFDSSFGTIEGEFISENGFAILGANIWAENTATGEVVSIVSDFLKQNTGFYQLHLKPGSYTLHANSINTLFFDGSSVGPYALFDTDPSFTTPHPITEVTLQDTTGNIEILTVVANQTIAAKLIATDTIIVPPKSSGGGGGSFSPLLILILVSLLLSLRPRNNFKD